MNDLNGLVPVDIEAQLNDWEGEPFDVLYADSPWHYRANSAKNWGRNAGRHYKLMSLKEIADLPVKRVVADQAVLFFWVTGPFLAIGAHVAIMKAWGFTPTAMGFTWIKLRKKAPGFFMDPKIDLHVGLGMTTRKNAEFCIIGKRGKSMRQSKKVHEVGIFPLMEHSRKPDQFRDRVEEYVGPGHNMLELFARESAPGWVSFGNQSSKFDGQVR